MATITKLNQPPEYWDRLFAPSSCLAMISTVDAQGRPNAASYGTCTRVSHAPVHIAFTCNAHADTAGNLRETGEFVVNLPRWERRSLEQVLIVGLPFARGVSEIEKAGFTPLPSTLVKPPRIQECPRHFECKVEWTKAWLDRLMVCGRVVAASVDSDCVDSQGWVIWNRVMSAHYCGTTYGKKFVAAYKVMEVEMTYEGPEAEANERRNERDAHGNPAWFRSG